MLPCWCASPLATPSVWAAVPLPKTPTPSKPGPKLPTKPKPVPTKPAPKKSHRLQGTRPALDRDSLLEANLRRTPLRKGTLRDFASTKVDLGRGKKVRVSDLETKATDRIAKKLRKLPKGALFGKVQETEEVYEFSDSLVIVKSTAATVADPQAVKKGVPAFGKLVKKRPVHVEMAKLKAESKAGLKRFKAEVAKFPAGHPLKQAMSKGDNALLDALANGVGRVEIVDTLHIPKKPPAVTKAGLQRPQVVGGRVDFGKTKKHKSKSKAAPPPPPPPPSTGQAASGAIHETREFVAGDTWGQGWVWERRWNVPSGYLRVTLGANYAVGLRIPIKVQTRMDPSWVCDDGPTREPRQRHFNLQVKAEAIDADAAFYRRAGMASDLIANGDELALQAGVGYGVKLRLFWTTLVNRPYREVGVDWGNDFDPPQGAASETVKEVFLPAKATKTEFDFGPLNGSARLGFRVDVRGKVRTRVSAKQAGHALTLRKRPTGSTPVQGSVNSTPQILELSNAAWKRYGFRLKNSSRPGSVPSYSQNFGFTVDKVEYDSSWSVVPGVKVRARASYAGYGIDETWTLWLEGAELPIGSLELGRHPGTREKHQNNRGRRVWHRKPPMANPTGAPTTIPPSRKETSNEDQDHLLPALHRRRDCRHPRGRRRGGPKNGLRAPAQHTARDTTMTCSVYKVVTNTNGDDVETRLRRIRVRPGQSARDYSVPVRYIVKRAQWHRGIPAPQAHVRAPRPELPQLEPAVGRYRAKLRRPPLLRKLHRRPVLHHAHRQAVAEKADRRRFPLPHPSPRRSRRRRSPL